MPELPALAPGALPLPQVLKEAEGFLRDTQRLLAVFGRDARGKSEQFQVLLSRYKSLGVLIHEGRKRLPPAPRPAPAARPAMAAPTALGLAAARRRATAAPAPIAPLTRKETQEQGQQPAAAPVATDPTTPAAQDHLATTPTNVHLPALPLALPKFAGTLGPPGSKAIDRGPPVTNLQTLLHALGYLVEPTGTYDAATFRAVQEFQLSRRIPVNGLVGLDTRKLFNELVDGQAAT